MSEEAKRNGGAGRHLSPRTLIDDPRYLLFDLRTGPELLFAQVTEETYRQSAFLDHRISPRPDQFFRLPLAQALAEQDQLPPPPALYIAHTSFCCSTLLARCAQSDALLCLREPRVLGVLANEYRRGLNEVQVDRLAEGVFRLLGKSWSAEQQVLIKATNFTNNLLHPWQRLWPRRKTLLMWGSLRDFLISMCKHGDEAARHLDPFLRAFLIDAGVAENQQHQYLQLPLLRRAVWVWVLQIRLFERVLQSQADVRTLSASDFLQQPQAVIARLYRWLGLAPATVPSEAVVNAVLGHDAKIGKTAAVGDVSGGRQRIEEQFQRDIADALQWAADQGLPGQPSFAAQSCL
ncbi:MAG: hypothetical protein Tsb002_17220 [Wenzhouxiangellaceae bacterium]